MNLLLKNYCYQHAVIANKGFSGLRRFVVRFNFSCNLTGNLPQSLTGHTATVMCNFNEPTKSTNMKKAILASLLFLTLATTSYSQTLHLYGGQNHDEYLGCLNCNSYDKNSIWNEYGTYGNSYNSKSIWNEYGTYGNEYNSNSPWNAYGSNPPVVVDKEGNFYGYFTVNEYKAKRADFGLALTIYKYYDLIRDDVSKWYDKIFE